MPSKSFGWLPRLVLALIALAVAGAGGWYAFSRARPAAGGEPPPAAEAKGPPPVSVAVVHPQPGGIERVVVQPGTVEPFQYADLYAKASGYLVFQEVDIGSRVKAGDVLARISVPEYEKQVDRSEAQLRDSKAKVKQMEAHQRAAQAEARAADASVTLAKVMVTAKTAYRVFREKRLHRIQGLAKERALDDNAVDEQEDYYQSAVEAENAAQENVNTAKEKASAAHAKIEQADADLDEAKADVGVAEAELAKAKVLLGYTVINSPYTGVVTRRSFHLGDFVKAADQGGTTPLLAVERTDLMRVVVQVPDRDVPFVHKGAPAMIEIDALPGVEFKTHGAKTVAVSRWADAEDPTTRTMRTEVDVPNPAGTLRHGMYGKATLILSEGTPNALRIPSAALVGRAEGGRGAVRVVREGTVHLVPVHYATDNGVEVEVVSGLTPADRVVVRASGPIEDGTAVSVGSENH
jgi:RND family efflux transporter MFP subunit